MPQYDPDKINIIIDGMYAQGLAPTMVSFEKSEDTASVTYGAQGAYDVAESYNTQGTITVTFLRSSPTLAMLRSRHNSRTHFPAYVTDKNDTGQVKAGGSDARVLSPPGGERGNEAPTTQVTITVFDYEEK
ncbi:phage structural protein [Salibacterium sp. K-3]